MSLPAHLTGLIFSPSGEVVDFIKKSLSNAASRYSDYGCRGRCSSSHKRDRNWHRYSHYRRSATPAKPTNLYILISTNKIATVALRAPHAFRIRYGIKQSREPIIRSRRPGTLRECAQARPQEAPSVALPPKRHARNSVVEGIFAPKYWSQ